MIDAVTIICEHILKEYMDQLDEEYVSSSRVSKYHGLNMVMLRIRDILNENKELVLFHTRSVRSLRHNDELGPFLVGYIYGAWFKTSEHLFIDKI